MSRNYHIPILICIVVLLLNTGMRFLVINEQKNQVQALQKTLAEARTGIDARPAQKKDAAFTDRQMIDTIVDRIPEAVLFTEHAARLRHLIARNDLRIDSSLIFRPADAPRAYLLRFDTRISAHGRYPRIKHLISDVLNMPGLICFNSIQLERDTDTLEENIRLSLDMSMFFKQGYAYAGR